MLFAELTSVELVEPSGFAERSVGPGLLCQSDHFLLRQTKSPRQDHSEPCHVVTVVVPRLTHRTDNAGELANIVICRHHYPSALFLKNR